MLLTVPWCLAIIAGRVNTVKGRPLGGRPKLSHGTYLSQMFSSGAFSNHSVSRAGWFMFLTMLAYFIIQVPSLRLGCDVENCGCPPGDLVCLKNLARREAVWAMAGLVISSLMFLVYLYDQLAGGGGQEVQEVRERIRSDIEEKAMASGILTIESLYKSGNMADLRRMLQRFFNHYDKDRSNDIDEEELALLVNELHEGTDMAKFIKEADVNRDGRITWDEFESGVMRYLRDGRSHTDLREVKTPPVSHDGHSDSEDEEVPEDFKHLSPEEQQTAIWKRSMSMMARGTALVLVFSDPMVGVLSSLGTRLGVSPFYISFMLAPLASNASELLAAYTYAQRKTEKTFTISLSTLIGAACMNNTFCLSIFLYLIYSNSLLWEFTAETSAIICIELVMFFFSQQKHHPAWQALVVLSLFPLSLAIVVLLEALGLD
eukprot:TRINITY_DN5927_c0_g1_i1.p1 TRINITY_DN5927_c0_g1~~TRINITY_DN5927_c0_g1_i1.p1  ORF type:complete len:431 (+),score=134.99 TRINITY_DN5927_c0_g1_i1:316-1608(+)